MVAFDFRFRSVGERSTSDLQAGGVGLVFGALEVSDRARGTTAKAGPVPDLATRSHDAIQSVSCWAVADASVPKISAMKALMATNERLSDTA